LGRLKSFVVNHDPYYRVLSAIVAIVLSTVAHRNCFAEFVFESLHSGVSVGNRIHAEGAKALGDALKENTTLTSLSLDLRGEPWFRS
jgi:hypothetical protein